MYMSDCNKELHKELSSEFINCPYCFKQISNREVKKKSVSILL